MLLARVGLGLRHPTRLRLDVFDVKQAVVQLEEAQAQGLTGEKGDRHLCDDQAAVERLERVPGKEDDCPQEHSRADAVSEAAHPQHRRSLPDSLFLPDLAIDSTGRSSWRLVGAVAVEDGDAGGETGLPVSGHLVTRRSGSLRHAVKKFQGSVPQGSPRDQVTHYHERGQDKETAIHPLSPAPLTLASASAARGRRAIFNRPRVLHATPSDLTSASY